MINWLKRLFGKHKPEKLTDELYPVNLRTNEAGIELIKEFEGFEAKAYKCPGDKWTIGYGFTEGVKQGDKIALEQANLRLKLELVKYEQCIKESVYRELTDNEFSALVCFIYNIGCEAFKNSTMLKYLNAGMAKSVIAQEFLRWDKVNGKIFPGLKRRRNAEAKLFLT